MAGDRGGHWSRALRPDQSRNRGAPSGASIAEEGCLSLPNWYGPVERATDVTVKGLGLNGKPVRHRLQDLAARVVLHEIDHLDGVVFTDRLVDPEKLRFVDPRSPEAQDLRAS